MKHYLFVLLLLCAVTAYGQTPTKAGNTHTGELSAGFRTTGSIFESSGNHFGIGAGGQVRYRINDMLNTEWFLDYISTDLGGLGARGDAHFGVSALIYPFKNPNQEHHFTPYVLGGFCGDYTKVHSNYYYDDEVNGLVQNSRARWSFATQMGLGTHFNVTKRFDLSASTQYMIHFGQDIHTEVETNSLGEEHLHIHQEHTHGLEGHWFFALTANFVLFDLLKNK